jgi:type IV pilus assembly protein PilQ
MNRFLVVGVLCLSVLVYAVPRDLSTQGLGIKVLDSTDSAVTFELSGSEFTSEVLSNPNRLVLDLSGKTLERNETKENLNIPFVERIRLGTHPDKTRVVFDLQDGVTGEVRKSDKGVIVTFKKADFAPTSERVASQSLVPLEAIPTTDDIAKLSSVEITKAKQKGNMVVARMSSIPEFNLTQTAPSEYVLKIKDAVIAQGADKTQVAPPGSGSIRSVRPVSKGRDLLLRIFAQPEASLTAHAENGSIYVTDEINLDDQLLIRAQANPKELDAVAKAPEAIENDDLAALLGGASQYTGRLISLDLQDTDIDNALRIIAEVSNLNIIASDDVTGKVTLRLIDVPWDQALDVILKTNGLDKVQEGNVIRIAPIERLRQEREALKQARQAEDELEPLQVQYVRVSYAKASAIKPILDSVVTERGSIAFDERTNQIIVKDIRKGIKNVVELIKKLDLRTPQVLLETQIVEAKRDFIRDLGAELGGSFISSPETGNATGWNFPNSINIGGSGTGVSFGDIPTFSSFIPSNTGSAISMIFDSADGARSLAARLTAYEQDGIARIVSRPSVATTNNTQASIEAVEVLRIKKPSGGTTVQTGSGSSYGSDGSATEQIRLGIKLTVTPQASPDYFVLLDIAAESSTLGANEVEGIPSTIERKANSSVLVSSGQTFAMGGIYKVNDNQSLTGVPFLKDIPVLGTFFRSSALRNSDEELLFFITPRIVEGSFDDASMKLSS